MQTQRLFQRIQQGKPHAGVETSPAGAAVNGKFVFDPSQGLTRV